MRVLITGVDGYIGFPFAMHLLERKHEVYGIDCFMRRQCVAERGSVSGVPIAPMALREQLLKEKYGDFAFQMINIATDYEKLEKIFKEFKPESIVNLAQIPSAPYSMIDAEHTRRTQRNNVDGITNLVWLMRKYAPQSHITSLGTMGEYGQPNMPIPEGFFYIEYKEMGDVLEFPKLGGSFYHVSKLQASKNLHYAAKTWDVQVTDIMQGVVYGTTTEEMGSPPEPDLRTRFDFDDCFGTMINRACACAVIGHPLIPYGSGEQTRAYIALRDSIRCLAISVENPPNESNSVHCYRVINQFDESYSCNEISTKVQEIAKGLGLITEITNIPNPRVEKEIHYYNPEHEKLYELGWNATLTLDQELTIMLNDLAQFKERMKRYKKKILPTVKWRD